MLDTTYTIHELMEVVVKILDSRDPYTFAHSWRVSALCESIVGKMGISPEWKDVIHVAAHLHDIGKIGVPDNILNKPGKLSFSEFEIIKNHSEIGYNIVKNIPSLEKIALYVRHHHERWDGKGYPLGLAGKDIPFGARIIAVADTFDALTSSRPYSKALSMDEAIGIIKCESSRQLCPETCDVFLSLSCELDALLNRVNSEIEENKNSQIKTPAPLVV